MADQTTPASRNQAPDPASSYERAKPQNEAGLGRMTAPDAIPHDQPDQIERAVTHRQDGSRQLNGQDAVDQRREGTVKK